MKTTTVELSSEFHTPYMTLKNPTSKIKDWYGKEFADLFFGELEKAGADFSGKKLGTLYGKSHKKLELKERLVFLASILQENLPNQPKKNIKLFRKILGKPWPFEEGMMNYGFYLYPISQLIENFDMYHTKDGLAFLEDFTSRFTAEFAIRPFLNKDPKGTLAQMKLWSKHENFHVRRLASEGLRIRLPWGQGVPWLKEFPKRPLPIFSKLRNDSYLYIRRSVANSMGDLIKVHPELAMDTFQSWLDKKLTKENLWVIRHAIRHPNKKGIPQFVKLKKEIEALEKKLKD